jgi:four helix bundle protein
MQDEHKLSVYREARELAIDVYRLTHGFPPTERYGLTQQLRRAAVSVGSNIAEGCGRKESRALIPFLYYAIGSTKELEFQIDLAVGLGCCVGNEADPVLERIARTRRMLIRLEGAVRRRSFGRPALSPPTPHAPPRQPR